MVGGEQRRARLLARQVQPALLRLPGPRLARPAHGAVGVPGARVDGEPSRGERRPARGGQRMESDQVTLDTAPENAWVPIGGECAEPAQTQPHRCLLRQRRSQCVQSALCGVIVDRPEEVQRDVWALGGRPAHRIHGGDEPLAHARERLQCRLQDGDGEERPHGLGVTVAALLLERLGDALADAAAHGLSPVFVT